MACWPVGLANAQALPNINSLSVRYNSMKTAEKATGELKAQLDDVDKAIADARRTGNIGEMRRQIAKGMTLLNKDAWTPQLDYRASLALRSDRTVRKPRILLPGPRRVRSRERILASSLRVSSAATAALPGGP